MGHSRWVFVWHEMIYTALEKEPKIGYEKDLQKEMFAQIQTRELFEQAKSYAYAYLDPRFGSECFPTEKAVKTLSVF